MPNDLYVRLAQPAAPTDRPEFERDRGDHRLFGAVTATHTETIETTDNDRAGVLLGTFSL